MLMHSWDRSHPAEPSQIVSRCVPLNSSALAPRVCVSNDIFVPLFHSLFDDVSLRGHLVLCLPPEVILTEGLQILDLFICIVELTDEEIACIFE